ncbi:hypothetical protein G6F24_014778 [Rhizopus arrhizus]|nr:hypothetical protein G6F24_014778 [Rhizopus arrhizus]
MKRSRPADREGLRQPGRARADRSHQRPLAGRPDQRQRRRRSLAQAVPAGPGRTGQRAVAAAGGHRKLSAAEVRPELPRPAGAAGRYREPGHRRTWPLHPAGAGLQHLHPLVPAGDHRQDLRLQDQAELHRGQRSADLQRAGGRFRQRAAAAAGTAAGPLTDAPGHCAAGPAAVAATGVAGAAVGADSGAGFAGGRYHRHAGYRAAAGAGAAGD